MTEQPSVDMVLVPRGLIEDARLALLCLAAEQVTKALAKDADRRFFDVHERLTAALKTSPQTALGTPGSLPNTDESKTTNGSTTGSAGE